MRILSAHQPNFAPWLPFFQKMVQSDVFVLLTHCQYEKNGWQNRCQVNGRWWTNPVRRGNVKIDEKMYADGKPLLLVNKLWIYAIAHTLGIDTDKIHVDYPTKLTGTDRLVALCKKYDADTYLTNPEAFDKYLEKDKFEKAGIKILEFKPTHKMHVFEAFDRYGIEGTRKICGI